MTVLVSLLFITMIPIDCKIILIVVQCELSYIAYSLVVACDNLNYI